MRARARQVGFIRLLLRSKSPAQRQDGLFRVTLAGKTASLPEEVCRHMAGAGLLHIAGDSARCRPEARSWLRRQLAEGDTPLADQHRSFVPGDADQARVNSAESPLARLAQRTAGAEPFLQPHHLDAAVRFQNLFARGHMRQRTTMSYDAVRVDESRPAAERAHEPQGAALDARRELERVRTAMPPDCATALFDICGFEKGLQLVESERGWPRRSAKLVLRIALDHLARYYGLAPIAEGREKARRSAWRQDGARPMEVG